MAITNISEQLRRDESVRQFAYDDADGETLKQGDTLKGKLTIGVGRNLTDVGLSDAEQNYLLGNDVAKITSALRQNLPWASDLDEARFGVLQNMGFNMGIGNVNTGSGLLGFPKMLSAMQKGDWPTASAEMQDSQWYHQVGDRAKRLQQQILTGAWQ
jgi:lysozyme